MASETNVVFMPQRQDPAIFEKSSALSWERLVRSGLLVLLGLIGVGGSIWGFYQEIHKQETRIAQAFETRSLQQANAIRSYLDSTLSAMKSVNVLVAEQGGKSNLSAASGSQNLRANIKHMLSNQHVIRSAAWMPKNSSGLFRVSFVDYSPFYGARTDQIYDAYTDELAPDRDISQIPSVKRAMDESLKEGRTALADLGDNKGVIALVPVYSSDQQATRQQRLENLEGFVVTVIDMAAVVEVGLQRANLFDVVTQQTLLNTSEEGIPGQLYARTTTQQNNASVRLLNHDTPIKIGGALWHLRLTAPYSVYGKEIPVSAWGVLATGLLITAILLAFAASLTRSARIEKLVHKRTAELKDAHEKVRDSEMMLVQAEKLSSIGGMVAGVAHEINTPLGFIRCNLEMMDEQLSDLKTACDEKETLPSDTDTPTTSFETSDYPLISFYREGAMDDMANMVTESLEGIGRIQDIVLSLKDFSRMDRLDFDEVDLHHCINSTLTIAHNNIKHRAEVVKDFDTLPLVSCSSGQINQVLLNLINNAAQAIENFGRITISTRTQGDKVRIAIQDNGKGISEQNRQKIFEPFFTTKDVGKGTGLGLSISQKIIHQHNGEILVESTEGVGTTFTIVLPIEQTLAKAA